MESGAVPIVKNVVIQPDRQAANQNCGVAERNSAMPVKPVAPAAIHSHSQTSTRHHHNPPYKAQFAIASSLHLIPRRQTSQAAPPINMVNMTIADGISASKTERRSNRDLAAT